jgi:hypothetical protein
VNDKTDRERAMIYLSTCLFAAERVEELHEDIYRESVEAREEAANQLRAVRDGDADAIAQTIEAMAWIAEGQQ